VRRRRPWSAHRLAQRLPELDRAHGFSIRALPRSGSPALGRARGLSGSAPRPRGSPRR